MDLRRHDIALCRHPSGIRQSTSNGGRSPRAGHGSGGDLGVAGVVAEGGERVVLGLVRSVTPVGREELVGREQGHHLQCEVCFPGWGQNHLYAK